MLTCWSRRSCVFTNAAGVRLAHFTVYKEFKKIVCGLGLDNVRFHDLRHPNVKPKTKSF